MPDREVAIVRNRVHQKTDIGRYSRHLRAPSFLISVVKRIYRLAETPFFRIESYHSWRSNSRGFVFSSRRNDGLYTRPYICYLGANGVPGKPFLLPQKEMDYYERSLFSFNIPELIRGKIKVDTYKLIDISKYGEAVRLK